MREIKFRAWHTVNKVMYNHKDIPVLLKNVEDDSIWKYMQYTGWKDKDGIDIYEGDVLRGLASTGLGGKSTKHKERLFEISFVPGRFDMDFFVDDSADNYRFLPSPEDCEVIGNIYQPNNDEQPTNIRPVS